ncbi:MAG: hypothetical protein GY888_08315 [Planctomycetaceae bacterium]|nr:hypothetical protein [Planctomycetaceae bacterium]
MVNQYRVQGLNYIRVDEPVYDPSTGTTTPSETTFTSAGAVFPSFSDQDQGGPSNEIEIKVAIFLGDVGDVIPTTRDRLDYLGRPWKVVRVDLSSGDLLYAAELTARAA